MIKRITYLLTICFFCGAIEYANPKTCFAADTRCVYEVTYSKAKTFQDINGKVYAQSIVGITNTGTEPIYLGLCKYILENEDGAVTEENYIHSYPKIIEPAETGYYYDICYVKKLNTVQDLNIVMKFEWDNDSAIKESKYKKKDLEITKINFYDNDNSRTIDFKCTIKAFDRYGRCYPKDVVAVFFDEEGDPIAIMSGFSMNTSLQDFSYMDLRFFFEETDNQDEWESEPTFYLKIDTLYGMPLIPSDITIDRDTEYIIYAYTYD